MTDATEILPPAKARLADLQGKHPPHYPLNSKGVDRPSALCGVLYPGLPAELRARLDAGTVTVGEIGKFKPTLETVPLEDDNFAIDMYTGLMDFYYDVGKALGGALVVRTTSPIPKNQQILAADEVADLVVKVYKEWQKYAESDWLSSLFRTDPRFRFANFVLSEPARKPVEQLVTSAELFMLAHELAHVALDLRLRAPPTNNDELNADTIGFEWYFGPVARIVESRMAYAGAAFAVRVTAGLERIGVKFARHYPSPKDRLDNLRTLFAKSCPSQQFCDEASTIMVAYQDQMDSVDNRFAPGSAPGPDSGRVRIRVIAELQEVAVNRLTRKKFVADIQDIARHCAAGDLTTIFAALHDYYVLKPPRESYLPIEMRMRMGEELVACGSMLPDDLRKIAGTDAVMDYVKTALKNHESKGKR